MGLFLVTRYVPKKGEGHCEFGSQGNLRVGLGPSRAMSETPVHHVRIIGDLK